MIGRIGKKIGMTQVFTHDGMKYPVTVIEVGPNIVVQKKSAQGKDGYTAVKLGFGAVHKYEKEGEEPRWRMNKPELAVFTKAGIAEPRNHLHEFRVSETELDDYEIGKEVDVTAFIAGQYVDVSGTSKGRGFAGVMKRHNFHGAQTMTHGTHENFRHAGSIGASADPARVVRGKRMPGQYGNELVTIQNLHIVEVIAEQNLMLVKGGVPGPNGGIVYVRTAAKRPKAHKDPGMNAPPEESE